jgi:hypothetical protein
MGTTHKQTITLTLPQVAYLKTEAEKLGISLADLVRRIIDEHRLNTSALPRRATK